LASEIWEDDDDDGYYRYFPIENIYGSAKYSDHQSLYQKAITIVSFYSHMFLCSSKINFNFTYMQGPRSASKKRMMEYILFPVAQTWNPVSFIIVSVIFITEKIIYGSIAKIWLTCH
jgi:hypothetical protein